MSKIKATERFCSYCNKSTKMSFIGEMAGENNRYWFRCTRCHHLSLLNVEAKAGEAKTDEKGIATIIYNPGTTYSVGEKIFHNEFNDVGKVTKKFRTSDGSNAIMVQFEKFGERKLLENFKQEIIEQEIPSTEMIQ
jgi:hypothetical protein